MNLIEQLGGYECAAYEYKNTLLADDFPYVIKATGTKFTRPELGGELLEHRRRHNIFEVGDKVVFKNVEKFKDNMLQVAHIELQKVLDIKSGLNGYTSFDELRHAEPEELEAGRRLEVNQ